MKTEHRQKDCTGITFSRKKLEAIVEAAHKGEDLEVFNNGKFFRRIAADSIISAINHPDQAFGGIIYHDYKSRGLSSGKELRLTK